MEGTFLREITLNFIVIGQRHYERVIVIPPTDKKVPEGEDMLIPANSHALGVSLTPAG